MITIQLSSYGVFVENKGIASAPTGSAVTGNVTTTGAAAEVTYQ